MDSRIDRWHSSEVLVQVHDELVGLALFDAIAFREDNEHLLVSLTQDLCKLYVHVSETNFWVNKQHDTLETESDLLT